MNTIKTIRPDQAGKYIHTAEGIIHISELFPKTMLRPDQLDRPVSHIKTGIKRPY